MVVFSSGCGRDGQASKIFLEDGHDLGGLHIAHDGHHHVRGHVVFVEELLGVGGGKRIQVGHPADGRPVIGMASNAAAVNCSIRRPMGLLSVRMRRSSITTSRSL